MGQIVCIFRIGPMCTLSTGFHICGYTRVSHFVSMLLLALALTLTLCFGVAAWRLSAGNDVEITATIPHGEYGWRARPRN